MEALRFETTIAQNGFVQIPEFYKFQNKIVQIEVTVKETTNELDKKKKILSDFFDQWSGYFSDAVEEKDERYNYLMEKYK